MYKHLYVYIRIYISIDISIYLYISIYKHMHNKYRIVCVCGKIMNCLYFLLCVLCTFYNKMHHFINERKNNKHKTILVPI